MVSNMHSFKDYEAITYQYALAAVIWLLTYCKTFIGVMQSHVLTTIHDTMTTCAVVCVR